MNKIFHILKLLLFLLLINFAHAATNNNATQPLPITKAFQLSLYSPTDNKVILHWDIADDYYLYRDRLQITIIAPENVNATISPFPDGITKKDAFFGVQQIYRDQLNIAIIFKSIDIKNIILKIDYQGCKEGVLCYPPTTQFVKIDALPLFGSSSYQFLSSPPEQSAAQNNSQKPSFWVLLSFLGMGILLAFTPCVLPMLPIISMIIVQQANAKTRRNHFTIAFVYILGMAFALALLGLIFSFLGANLQIYLQKPVFIIAVIIIFVALALSMFDLWNISFLDRLQTRFQKIHYRPGYLGIACMGAISSLVVSPCISPPLATALIYLATVGNIFFGMLSLFILGLGMGLPLLLFSIGLGAWLPRAGVWMQHVKVCFGFLLLGLSIWLTERLNLGTLPLYLFAFLCLSIAFYLQIKIKPQRLFLKLINFLLVAVFILFTVIYGIGGFTGANTLLYPLSNLNYANKNNLKFMTVTSLTDLNQRAVNGNFLTTEPLADHSIIHVPSLYKTRTNPHKIPVK